MTAGNMKPFGKWMLFSLFVLLAAAVPALFLFSFGKSASPGLTFAADSRAKDVNESEAGTPAANKDNNHPQDANEEQMPRPDHNHPAFNERVDERQRMVAKQIRVEGRSLAFRTPVRDANVLAAMRTVPRHAFVTGADQRRAYADHPLPIGLNQTISQPYIVAYMTEAVQLRSDSKVFEVGTGSGYQAAVCAEIAREVYTVEIIEKLAQSAKNRLNKLGYRNVKAKHADGYYGWEENAPFDAIIITAATTLVPPPLIEQLKPGGRMILPQGSPYGSHWLVLITKDEQGQPRSRRLMPVRFVPMTGRVTEAPEKPPK
jgi:protein-L-isoaspartate(D-aspartate) O-methyltransferase